MRKSRKLDKNYKMQELKKQQAMNEDYKRAVSFVIVLIVIIVLLDLLVYLNGKFVSKDLFQDPTTTTTTEPAFNSKNILISNIFDIKDKEYMVLIYDTKDDIEDALYAGAAYSYNSDKVKLYTVDLANKMNRANYKKDGKENTNPAKSSEIVITRSTLMIIKDGKVTSYITDSEEILKKLSQDKE